MMYIAHALKRKSYNKANTRLHVMSYRPVIHQICHPAAKPLSPPSTEGKFKTTAAEADADDERACALTDGLKTLAGRPATLPMPIPGSCDSGPRAAEGVVAASGDDLSPRTD
mmetsp:Transcript_86836/g.278566  ORF Transcript_86836/g.278566 Transcript_86836/m.278566 type:complete len:112 (-) Transcript_86836:1989-2324(-)